MQFLPAFGGSVDRCLEIDLTHYDKHNDSTDTVIISDLLRATPCVECLKLKV